MARTPKFVPPAPAPKEVEKPKIRIVRDAPFAQRITKAADHHPHVPPIAQGRLSWFRDRFKADYGIEISLETVRKWFYGEAKPRPDKMTMLAKMLEVDEGWLSLGLEPDLQPREQKARNAVADGAVNLLAGVIQMNGGNPAFPVEGDRRAERNHIDLYAIIRGAQYAFHVSLAAKADVGYRFTVPSEWEDAFQMGVIMVDPTTFWFIEIGEFDVAKGTKRGGFVEVTISHREAEKRRITNFSQRI